jgi:hypothetical protein
MFPDTETWDDSLFELFISHSPKLLKYELLYKHKEANLCKKNITKILYHIKKEKKGFLQILRIFGDFAKKQKRYSIVISLLGEK